MIHYSEKNKSLEKLILTKHDTILCDEINIISAFIGPDPLKRLKYIGLSTGPIFPNSTDNVDIPSTVVIVMIGIKNN